MWTPRSQPPPASGRTLTASSKSWAFSPSIVTVGQSRKSRRPARAAAAIEVGDARGFLQDVLRELGPQAVTLGDDLDVDAGVVRPAEDALQGERRPVGFDDHARRGPELAPGLERDVVDGGRIERLEVRGAAALDVDAEEPGPVLLEDALDAALGLAELALLVDDDGDLVPRQGPVGVAGRDEDVRAAALRRDETETGARGDETAADDPRLLGQAKAAPEQADVALGFEPADLFEDLGPVPALGAELGHELVEREPFLVFFEEREDPDSGHGCVLSSNKGRRGGRGGRPGPSRRRAGGPCPRGRTVFPPLSPFRTSASAAALSAAVASAQSVSSISASILSSAAGSALGAARAARAFSRSRFRPASPAGRASTALAISRRAFSSLLERGAAPVTLRRPAALSRCWAKAASTSRSQKDEGDGLRSRLAGPEPLEGPRDALEDDAEGDPLVFPGRDHRLVLGRKEERPAAALEERPGDLPVVAALSALVLVHGRGPAPG